MQFSIKSFKAIFVHLLIAACSLGIFDSSSAQVITPPPAADRTDENGVNIASGNFNSPNAEVVIGTDDSHLKRYVNYGADSNAGVTAYSKVNPFGIPYGGGEYLITLGLEGRGYRFRVAMVPPNNYGQFTISAGPYNQFDGSGTLTCSGTSIQDNLTSHPVLKGGECVMTLSDGTSAHYDFNKFYNAAYATGSNYQGYTNIYGVLTYFTRPDGERVDVTYYTADSSGSVGSVKAVKSSLGWFLLYEVGANNKVSKVTGVNASVSSCDLTTAACSNIQSDSPSAQITSTNETATTSTNTIYRNAELQLTVADNQNTKTITSSSGVNKVVAFDNLATQSNSRVNSVTKAGSTFQYAYQYWDVQNTLIKTVTVTAPNLTQRVYNVSESGDITAFTDEAGRKTKYEYVGSQYANSVNAGRVSKIINPDASYSGTTLTGGYQTIDYDGRGNVIKVTTVPKGAGTDTTKYMVKSAVYPTSCSNPIICNKPTSVTDENGVTTNYTYDPIHGGVLTQTAPAVNGITAQTLYKYAKITPKAKNASGGYDNNSTVWRLIETRSCMSLTLATCANGADERVEAINYGAVTLDPVDGVTMLVTDPTYKNVLPASKTVKRGDGAYSNTTTFTYDIFGQLTSVDGPLTGAYDTTTYFYDPQGRKTAVIGSDPDGAGIRPRAAQKTTYTNGLVTEVKKGTVTGTTWASLADGTMTLVERETANYNAAGMPTVAKVFYYGATTPSKVSQVTYDNMFRVDCQATRLNPVDFTNLPASACAQGTTQANGLKDDITKINYDALGNVVSTIDGYGAGNDITEFTKVFDISTATSTGNLLSQTDAKGNKTTYSYDGFNRLIKTCYPDPSNGTLNPGTDCEQVGYGSVTIDSALRASGRPSTTTLRDNQVINIAYDNRSRVSSLSGAVTESFTYDNFNQLKTHTANGVTNTYYYISMGWLWREVQPAGTVDYGLDNYGRVVKIVYPDANYVGYVYNYSNEVERICNNAYGSGCLDSNALIKFSYDSLGRRIGITRANGFNDGFGFDNSLRLETMSLAAAGTGSNTISLGYTQADQIASRSQTNTAFAPPAPSTGITDYTINGLNQMTKAGVSNLSYDTRGNMTSDGAVTFTYNAYNRLVSTSSGVTLAYDADQRLRSLTSGTTTTKFLYAGTALIAEYDGSTGTMLRRYIHGPGMDEPLVWYEGTTLTNPRYFMADERGSVIGVTDSTGNILAINSYDEYGVPSTTNATYAGRFRYTGQTWLPEIGLYYYKARMYAPTLGRFLQTDPIGYDDGMNWYNYVGSDPINSIDPFGLCAAESKDENGDPVITICPPDSGGGGFGYDPGIYIPEPLGAKNNSSACKYASNRSKKSQKDVNDQITNSWRWNDKEYLKFKAGEAYARVDSGNWFGLSGLFGTVAGATTAGADLVKNSTGRASFAPGNSAGPIAIATSSIFLYTLPMRIDAAQAANEATAYENRIQELESCYD